MFHFFQLQFALFFHNYPFKKKNDNGATKIFSENQRQNLRFLRFKKSSLLAYSKPFHVILKATKKIEFEIIF